MDKPFPKKTVTKILADLGLNPRNRFVRSNGTVITVRRELQEQLDFIQGIFSRPAGFARVLPPKQMQKMFAAQHRTIMEALETLQAIQVGKTKEDELARRYLFDIAGLSGSLSGGLVGHDVAIFDKNFQRAISSLEQIGGYFSAILENVKATQKGPGKDKPGNPYADNLVVSLCRIYKNLTGEAPTSSVKVSGTARGRIIGFLQSVLSELPYPLEITDWALEKKLREIKKQKIHRDIWEDAKG